MSFQPYLEMSLVIRDMSNVNIDRCLKKFHYTIKKISIVPDGRNNDRTIDLREKYAENFRRIETVYEDKNIIFADEVGFSVSTRPKRGRAQQGRSAYVDVSAVKTRNISVFAAMNKYS